MGFLGDKQLADENNKGYTPASTSTRESKGDTFGTIIIRYDRDDVDIDRLTEIGFPTALVRSKVPVTSASGRPSGIPLSRKRVHAKVSRSLLENDDLHRPADPHTMDELLQRRSKQSNIATKRSTMMDSMTDDVVAVRLRKKTAMAMYQLFHSNDVQDPLIFYGSSTDGGADLNTQPSNAAPIGIPVQWSTLILSEPDAEEDREVLSQDKVTKEEQQKAYFAKQEERANNAELVLAELREPPSARNENLLEDLLAHLQQYGGIWARAGHVIRPTLHNRNPRQRACFAVQGVFPDPFLDYCHKYLGADDRGAVDSADPNVQHFVRFFHGWRVRAYKEPRSLGNNFAYGSFAAGMAAIAA